MSEQSSQQESVEAEPEIHRESMDVDVLFVGAGAASLAGAIRLMQCIQAHNESGEGDPIQDPTIAIVEKGSEVGAHILSGAVLNPQALDELLPDWREQAPIGPEVDDEDVTFLTENIGINTPEGARTVAVEKPVPMDPTGPQYSTKPSNSVTFGFRTK